MIWCLLLLFPDSLASSPESPQVSASFGFNEQESYASVSFSEDPFRPTAVSCRYNALRSPTAGVGQGGGSTSERARVDCTRDRPSGQTT